MLLDGKHGLVGVHDLFEVHIGVRDECEGRIFVEVPVQSRCLFCSHVGIGVEGSQDATGEVSPDRDEVDFLVETALKLVDIHSYLDEVLMSESLVH